MFLTYLKWGMWAGGEIQNNPLFLNITQHRAVFSFFRSCPFRYCDHLTFLMNTSETTLEKTHWVQINFSLSSSSLVHWLSVCNQGSSCQSNWEIYSQGEWQWQVLWQIRCSEWSPNQTNSTQIRDFKNMSFKQICGLKRKMDNCTDPLNRESGNWQLAQSMSKIKPEKMSARVG